MLVALVHQDDPGDASTPREPAGGSRPDDRAAPAVTHQHQAPVRDRIDHRPQILREPGQIPRMVRVGAKAFAHVRASDATSGLRRKPKRKIRIRTSNVGKRVTKVTAVDKTGNRRSARCVTRVVAS